MIRIPDFFQCDLLLFALLGLVLGLGDLSIFAPDQRDLSVLGQKDHMLPGQSANCVLDVH